MVGQYAVTITQSGKEYGTPCTNDSLGDPNIIAVEEGKEGFRCETFDNYAFNLANHRFLDFYPFGYLNGADNGDDTPSVTAGTCTRID
jgi:hypothetical protein